MRKIYVASSWRNEDHETVVAALRDAGHQVHDYRDDGFSWSLLDPDWKEWTPEVMRCCFQHPVAQKGFNADFDGMKWADTGLLLLPSGRSAHLELGWMAGAGKTTIILTKNGEDPDLMMLLATYICTSFQEVLDVL